VLASTSSKPSQLIFAAEVRKDELYACMRLLSCT
jgi:hypothetical protein